MGARDREDAVQAVALAGQGSLSGTLEEAADFGEAVLWTMREPDPAKVLADPAVLNGKIIVDLNNRDYENEVRIGGWFTEFIAEQLQAHVPQARVVKALNTLAMESFDILPRSFAAPVRRRFWRATMLPRRRQ